MNTIRMIAFAAAVLITAFLFGAIGDAFTFEQPIHCFTRNPSGGFCNIRNIRRAQAVSIGSTGGKPFAQ